MTVHYVTGADGHVGNNVCRQLLTAGRRVVALVLEPGGEALAGLDLEQRTIDITRPETLRGLFDADSVVIHLAAVISTTGKDDDLMHRVNVGGTRNLVDACMVAGIRRLVHVSTVQSFRQAPVDTPLDPSRPRIGPAAGAYDWTKLLGEREVERAIRFGLNAVIMHPSGVLGPHDYAPSIMGRKLVEFCGRAMPAIAGAGYDWVDVRDVAGAIVAATDRGPAGAHYILGGRYCPMEDFSALLQRKTGGPEAVRVVPTRVIAGALPIMRMTARLRGRPPAFTRAGLDALLEGNRALDSGRARAELGYASRPLEETLDDTLAWLVDRGRIDPRILRHADPSSASTGRRAP